MCNAISCYITSFNFTSFYCLATYQSYLFAVDCDRLLCLLGYVASRHLDFGSQYIRCLVYVFSRKAHIDHVQDMLTEVSCSVLLVLFLRNQLC